MTRTPGAAADGLAEFEARLRGGITLALDRGRPADWRFRDAAALGADWPPSLGEVLRTIRRDPWDDGPRTAQVIDEIAACLGGGRDLLVAVLFAPADVLGGLPAPSGQGSPAVDRWMAMCWIAEAAWQAADSAGLRTDSAFAVGDDELLRPLAARLRFLALSEPMRWRAQQPGAWWAGGLDLDFGDSGIVDRVFGDGSWNLLNGKFRESRRIWLESLDSYQSHPFLAQAKPKELEAEISALMFTHPHGFTPLGVSREPLARSAALTAEDLAVAGEVSEGHLLPRFDLRAVLGLALYDPNRWLRAARKVVGLVVAAAALAVVALAARLRIHDALVAAVICYGLLAAGVVIFGSRWASLWLLRLPAASTVGLVALISLLPEVALQTPLAGWAACAVLAGAAYGYLLVEARNHGVGPGAALLRSALVTLTGAVHALLVSVIGLVAVAPAFSSHGRQIAALWRHPGYGHAGMLLLLSAAWCLAVGVFSQILWDDRPITAPLAHLQWRSGR
ncbi:MAG TPA: hypothetical protein VMV07_22960 [Streptosporangiaceae bacterium]|nr:hypothetical protein [Streptosporangiaceae bacterium]